MSTAETPSLHPDTLTVVTWNILLDYTRTDAGLMKSQFERAPSLVSSLDQLRDKLQRELDVVGIQEAHKSKERHNGEFIAQALGYGKGEWVEHNQKPIDNPKSKTGRKGEYVGLFGARVNQAEPIELGDNRRAIITHIGNKAIVNIHTRAGVTNGNLRAAQVETVLDRVEGIPSVAFIGDFNNRLGGKARQAIEAREFESVFTILGEPHPGIYPTPDYRQIMYGPAHKIIPSGVLDDIYVRGMGVIEAGSFIGDSDHAGLYAVLGK